MRNRGVHRWFGARLSNVCVRDGDIAEGHEPRGDRFSDAIDVELRRGLTLDARLARRG